MRSGPSADEKMRFMRSVTGFCATFGAVLGGYLPVLWGASAFSLSSLFFAFVGAIVGLWVGVRLLDL